CPSISDGRLSYQFSSDGYIRRSVYAYGKLANPGHYAGIFFARHLSQLYTFFGRIISDAYE
ncbi:hypothetical protein, partial [Escherichia coli]|uniref:hypothetical protein n=1 Tax=Escherichia coli TaxID=562 RepID=UPI001A8CAA7E